VQVKRRIPAALLVFLVPPSRDELERRLRARGTEGEAAVARRLAEAEREIARSDEFDHVVVNDDLDRCVTEVVALIDQARTRAP
jgi:guanylate kinase